MNLYIKNMDESHKHTVEQKKSYTIKYLLYDSFYIKFIYMQN